MENNTLIIIVVSVVGILIWSWIIYEIIFASSYGRKIWVEARKQTALLKEMAKKSGVHEGTISEIFEERQYKPVQRF